MRIKPLVYLCGPIHGLTATAARYWRTEAAALLAPEFEVLDPMHGKDYAGTDYSEYTDQEIVVRDLAYIARARAVLRYYDGESTEGSAQETFYAAQRGIPVVTFGSPLPRAALSLWVRVHTVRNYVDMSDAVRYLKEHWLQPGEEVEEAYNAGDSLAWRSTAAESMFSPFALFRPATAPTTLPVTPHMPVGTYEPMQDDNVRLVPRFGSLVPQNP